MLCPKPPTFTDNPYSAFRSNPNQEKIYFLLVRLIEDYCASRVLINFVSEYRRDRLFGIGAKFGNIHTAKEKYCH